MAKNFPASSVGLEHFLVRQIRVLILTPPPQEALQEDQPVHSVKSSSTGQEFASSVTHSSPSNRYPSLHTQNPSDELAQCLKSRPFGSGPTRGPTLKIPLGRAGPTWAENSSGPGRPWPKILPGRAGPGRLGPKIPKLGKDLWS